MKRPPGAALGALLATAAAVLAGQLVAERASATVPDPPQRIVSLSPSITEWLYAIGAGDQVVAVDQYSNYPAGTPITELSGFQPNVEAISTYDPDLVLLASDRDGITEALAAVDIPTMVVTAPADMEQLAANVTALGAAVGHEDEAAEALGELNDGLAGYTAATDQPAQTYYWELSDAYHTVTSETLIGALLEPLGLVSVADDVDSEAGAYPQLTAEFVLDADPDLVVVAWAAPSTPISVDDVADRPGWSTLQAVTDGRVVVLDSDVATRWGPRVVEMVADVADAVGLAALAPGSVPTSS